MWFMIHLNIICVVRFTVTSGVKLTGRAVKDQCRQKSLQSLPHAQNTLILRSPLFWVVTQCFGMACQSHLEGQVSPSANTA